MSIFKNLIDGKKYFNDLMRNGDMLVTPTDGQIQQLKKLLLNCYVDVKNVCEKYKIPHFLAYGSALGAVRHSGYIPWDDDLDICMFRKDFFKFKKIFHKELGKKYILNAPNYSKTSKCRFPVILIKNAVAREISDPDCDELRHLKIDLFLLDSVPKSRIERCFRGLICNGMQFIQGQVAIYENVPHSIKKLMFTYGKIDFIIRVFVGKVFSFYSASKWNDLIDQWVQCKWKQSGYFGCMTDRKHYFGEWFRKDQILPASYEFFEKNKVPVFHDVDFYLKKLYGDYMQIPAVREREKHFFLELELDETE